MKNWLVGLALGAASFSAMAGDNLAGGFYAGGGLASVDFDIEGSDVDVSWTAVEAIGGYKLNSFVGGEARLGYATDDIDILYSSIYYRTESSNDTAKTYLLFGYTFGRVSGPDGEEDADVYGFSYGAGVGFPVTSNLNFNLEYRMILDGKLKVDDESADTELSGVSLNIDYRF